MRGGGIILVLVTATSFYARFVGWACTSGDETSGSLEDTLCNWLDDMLAWSLTVLLPAVLYGATQITPKLRPHAVPIAMWISVVTVAFWVAVGAVVIDVG